MSSFLKKMGYAAETIKDVASGVLEGELLATSEEKDRRLSICAGCPYFDANLTRCNECGCFEKIKANLAKAKCPLKKW